MTERGIDVEGDEFAIAYPPAEGAAIVPALSVFPRRRYVREPEPRWLAPSQNDNARQQITFAEEFGFGVTLLAQKLHKSVTRPDPSGWEIVAEHFRKLGVKVELLTGEARGDRQAMERRFQAGESRMWVSTTECGRAPSKTWRKRLPPRCSATTQRPRARSSNNDL